MSGCSKSPLEHAFIEFAGLESTGLASLTEILIRGDYYGEPRDAFGGGDAASSRRKGRSPRRFGPSSLGAGRVLWPVIAAILRVVVVLGGGLILLETEGAGPADFFWLIAAGMATQAMVTGVAIRLGAWTRGIDKESDSEE